MSSSTIIKADPGYLVLRPEPGDYDAVPYCGVIEDPVIAWEIERGTEEGTEWTAVTAIGSKGFRGGRYPWREADSPGSELATFSPTAIKYPDGLCYDGDTTYPDEASMLEDWNKIKLGNLADWKADRERKLAESQK